MLHYQECCIIKSCSLCQSGNQAEFAAEMVLHFSGVEHLHTPSVLAFPKVSVCLDCGFSRFTTPETELRALRNDSAAAAG